MYIQPSTRIKVYNNIPLVNNYKHTLYFDTILAQNNFFHGTTSAKYSFENYSYQRVGKGKIRVNEKADSLYDCGYMAFQNEAFGHKWFYAFITSVEYVNNAVAEISYEIDVIQTYLIGDCTLKESFVEREHSATDQLFSNLIPENLSIGEYVSDDFDGSQMIGQKVIVVAANFDEDYRDIGGNSYGNMYSGLKFHVFENSTSGYANCSDFIQGASAAGKAGGIVSVFMMPQSMVCNELESPKSYEFSKYIKLDNFDGYVPKNAKLFSYPFNFLYVTNLQGTSCAFQYEYFPIGSTSCRFLISGDMSCNPTVILVPLNYKGVAANYDEKMTLSGYPQCSYNSDTFKSWLANNLLSIPISMASSAVSFQGALNSATSSASVFTGVQGELNLLNSEYRAAIAPDQSHGSVNGSVNFTLGIMDFAFMHKHITREYAEIIDKFFDKYGYATNQTKIPNISSRPHWNYVKTVNAIITGRVPSDDLASICSIFDNGVTFWKNASEIGDYSLDNRP